MNQRTSKGSTALKEASFYGHDEIVRLLIEKGADVNMGDEGGWTPLIDAASKGKIGAVNALLESEDIEVNKCNNEGSTPLFMCWQLRYV